MAGCAAAAAAAGAADARSGLPARAQDNGRFVLRRRAGGICVECTGRARRRRSMRAHSTVGIACMECRRPETFVLRARWFGCAVAVIWVLISIKEFLLNFPLSEKSSDHAVCIID
jgi:hypothetical protein